MTTALPPVPASAGDAPSAAGDDAGGLPSLRWPAAMRNPVRDYDWGSTTALARLQGRQPSGGPEAELWIGAHPSAPSMLVDGGGTEHALLEVIESAPVTVLGRGVVERFGPRLPYLLKILAISRPLSVQVHPGAERAAQGFHADEGDDGIHRYVDPWPKPEMLYVLEPVEALCGFRAADQATHLLDLFDSPRLAQVAEALAGSGQEHTRLEAAFTVLVTWPDPDRKAFAAEVADEAAALVAGADGGDPAGADGGGRPRAVLTAHDRATLEWVVTLARHHPRDPLVAVPLLLDLVHLEPGETLFVPAGAPHAYLHGVGVEIMGNSDNVLRAGLTSKPISVAELLWVVDGRTRPQRAVPRHALGPAEVAWRPGAQEFQLTRIRPGGTEHALADIGVDGPQILLCTAGEVTVTAAGDTGPSIRLSAGTSCFVGAGAPSITLSGTGEVFRAAVGDASA